MLFEMSHRFLKSEPKKFTELTAPDWLTSRNTVKDSTMDNRWFWEEYILTMPVGKVIETDFQSITRVG